MKKKFIVVFILSLLTFSGVFWVANRVLDIMEVTSKVEFLGHELGEGNVIEQTVENELLFLVLGMDSDDFSGHTTEQNRTDTMILAKVNFDTGKIDILSIPRDSRVLIRGKYDKINHAHHFGGLKLAMKTTRDFLNLDIDYYVKVNFFSVKDIVDVLGGVEVDVPVKVDVNEDNVHLKPGLQVLNGKQALQFARFRAGYAEGDLGRVKSQQLLIKALIKELTKPQNIVKMPQILEVVKKTVSTNIPFSTIAKLALKVKNLSPDKINSKIVPGDGRYIGDISYYVPYKKELSEIIKTEYADYILNANAKVEDDDVGANTNSNRRNGNSTRSNDNNETSRNENKVKKNQNHNNEQDKDNTTNKEPVNKPHNTNNENDDSRNENHQNNHNNSENHNSDNQNNTNNNVNNDENSNEKEEGENSSNNNN